MASLVLDNLPSHLIERLQQRALARQVTVEQQAIELLEQGLEPAPSFTDALAQWRSRHPDDLTEDHPFEDLRSTETGREFIL